MPLELQIIRASEFIRLGAQGRLDLAASREILKLLARACWLRGISRALLDLRDIRPAPTPLLSSKDLEALVNAFCQMGFSDQLRLAVLYSADPHRRARQFAFMTALRGWNVKASDNFEETLLWLSTETEAERTKQAGGQEIPIQVKGTASALPTQAQPREESRQEMKTPPPPSNRHRTPAAPTKRRSNAGRSRA